MLKNIEKYRKNIEKYQKYRKNIENIENVDFSYLIMTGNRTGKVPTAGVR
jgi:hypothetical protein